MKSIIVNDYNINLTPSDKISPISSFRNLSSDDTLIYLGGCEYEYGWVFNFECNGDIYHFNEIDLNYFYIR